MQRPRNPYSSAEIDRASHEREDDERMIELASSGAARFVPIDTEKNLVKTGGNPEAVFLQGMMARAVASAADTQIFLGYVEGTPYFAVDVTGKETPLGELGEFVDLRQVGPLLFAREGSILAYARGMTYWHRRHRYCGVCGAATKVTRGGHVRMCTNESCKTEHFPRTDPGGDHAGPSRRQVPAGPRQAFPAAACIRPWRASSSPARASRTPSRARSTKR